jgi:hypothetical protein
MRIVKSSSSAFATRRAASVGRPAKSSLGPENGSFYISICCIREEDVGFRRKSTEQQNKRRLQSAVERKLSQLPIA